MNEINAYVAVALATGTKEFIVKGMEWLIDLATAPIPELQTAKLNNLIKCIKRLDKRIRELEDEKPDIHQILQDACNNPSTFNFIQKALAESTNTDSEIKHEILADLITQRILAEDEDMIALAGQSACNAVNALSTKHIKLLALLVSVKNLEFENKPCVEDLNIAYLILNQIWSKNLQPLIEGNSINEISDLDYEHLSAIGCIRISITAPALMDSIKKQIQTNLNIREEHLHTFEWFNRLQRLGKGFVHSIPTSIGQIIGITHRDQLLNNKTKINW